MNKEWILHVWGEFEWEKTYHHLEVITIRGIQCSNWSAVFNFEIWNCSARQNWQSLSLIWHFTQVIKGRNVLAVEWYLAIPWRRRMNKAKSNKRTTYSWDGPHVGLPMLGPLALFSLLLCSFVASEVSMESPLLVSSLQLVFLF